MTKPLRADAERNRRRILDSARELFACRGLSVGLDEIAHHAGVGVGTAYRRFPCKADLIEAIFEERIAGLTAAAEAGLAEADPWQGLVTWMERSVELHATDLSVKQLVFGAGGDEGRVTAVRERIAPLAYEIVRRAQASGQLRPDVETTDLPLLQFMIASLGQFGPPELELWRRGLAVALDGLRTGSTTPVPGRALTDEEFGRAIANPAGTVQRR
jgi:AcrR family transcriptional regulator